MALTTTEEAQTRQLIADATRTQLLSLADNGTTIISKLGASKVNLSQLPAAASIADADIMLIRQGTTDRTVAASVLKTYSAATTGTTPPQFDNSNKFSTTAFSKRQGLTFGAIRSITSNRTLVAADMGAKLLFQGVYTLSVPKPSSIGATEGDAFMVGAFGTGGSSVVFTGGSTYQYDLATLTDPISVGPGVILTLIVENADNWQIGPSTAGLDRLPIFDRLLATSGYQRLPGRLRFQWGQTASIAAGASQTITFPVAFSTALYSITTGLLEQTASDHVKVAIKDPGLTGFVMLGDGTTGTVPGAYWLAVGY